MKAKKFLVFEFENLRYKMRELAAGQITRKTRNGFLVKLMDGSKVLVCNDRHVAVVGSEKTALGVARACQMCLRQCLGVKAACNDEYYKNLALLKENVREWAVRERK